MPTNVIDQRVILRLMCHAFVIKLNLFNKRDLSGSLSYLILLGTDITRT